MIDVTRYALSVKRDNLKTINQCGLKQGFVIQTASAFHFATQDVTIGVTIA
jgi:hypothetical protein